MIIEVLWTDEGPRKEMVFYNGISSNFVYPWGLTVFNNYDTLVVLL